MSRIQIDLRTRSLTDELSDKKLRHWRNNTRFNLANRGGAALLLCLFVVAVTSLLVVRMLDSQVSAMSAYRNTVEYDQALHLAGAAVHHALAELEADFTWRGTVSEGAFPADDTYSASAVDGLSGEVIVTGSGAKGEVIRTLEVTLASQN